MGNTLREYSSLCRNRTSAELEKLMSKSMKTAVVLEKIRKREPFFWINENYLPAVDALPAMEYGLEDIVEAENILKAYAPVFRILFPELEQSEGIIESPLTRIPQMAEKFKSFSGFSPSFELLLKADHALPVSGSIKARGGIFAVLKIVDAIAEKEGFFNEDRSFAVSSDVRAVFSSYTIAVGSTGNLGLSIGIAGRAFGFKVKVHMSSDAKEWKKKKLRNLGAEVIEYESDYSMACEGARSTAENNPYIRFIDDENSADLFWGYSVAAIRLKTQLEELGIGVSKEHPLFIYLPCGVGGAPGGITFSLKHLFGDAVHCFFAEPVEAPAMVLGLITGKHSGISVKDVGLTLDTCADGLAVGRPSDFVSRMMNPLLDGAFTVPEPDFYKYLTLLFNTEGIRIEPSASAGFAGIPMLFNSLEGRNYLSSCGLKPENITHIVWTTGGSMEPEEEFFKNYNLSLPIR